MLRIFCFLDQIHLLELWQAEDPDVLGRRCHNVDMSLHLTSL